MDWMSPEGPPWATEPMMLHNRVIHKTFLSVLVHGDEYFHGQPQATEKPLNAGFGLVTTAESKTMVPSPGHRCPEGEPTPCVR